MTFLKINPLEKINKKEKILFKKYEQQALKNIGLMSRTMRGVLDTSASADKADKVSSLEGEELARLALENYKNALQYAFDNRNTHFEDTEQLRSFIETVALQINEGILKEGENIIRSGSDSKKYPYTRIDDLPERIEEFYNILLEKISSITDPVEIAAFVEYRIDLTDHFFADGCGKSAKVISSWVMMKNNMNLPDYSQDESIPEKKVREEYYRHAPKTIPGTNPEEEQEKWNDWLTYYKTLCKDNF